MRLKQALVAVHCSTAASETLCRISEPTSRCRHIDSLFSFMCRLLACITHLSLLQAQKKEHKKAAMENLQKTK
eukprot:18816-Heterococcus_DN1.PRE.2